MRIRLLEGADLDALLTLYGDLHAHDDRPPVRTDVEKTWNEILGSERFLYFGGFVGDALVSACNLTLVPNLTRACRPFGLIENVVTHCGKRQKGYGSAVLRAALDHAWRAGCYKVMLLTGRRDEATLRFYRSVGFDAEGKQGFIARPPR